MPRSSIVDPHEMRQPGTLTLPTLTLNAYVADPTKELRRYGRDTLRRVYYDMLLVREFESMLDSLKRTEEYQGVRYNHKGPAHLSIGQEAAVVGQALALDIDDFVFGSHRSHGEILAKCMRAIALLEPSELQQVMTSYMDGEVLAKVEADFSSGTVQELAEAFVLYGTLAEIFGRAQGFNRGLGGSMHAFFAPFGSMPNNAIVGGSADIAVGAALYKRCNKQSGIVIANLGDAASACGPTWEAMMFAAMDQYRKLWPESAGGAPPILFNFFNNFYGMGGQTWGETMGFDVLARIGAGVNPDAMHAERVDGFNPLAVADAIARKRDVLEAGQGPVLLDTVTYRYSGHSPSDASSYRSRDEVELWRQHDGIAAFAQYLCTNSLANEQELHAMHERIRETLKQVCALTVSLETSPRVDVNTLLDDVMFANHRKPRMREGSAQTRHAYQDNPRIVANRKKHRSAYSQEGEELPASKCITFRDALFEAMLHRFCDDPSMIAFGEENRDWGGAFAVYRGLTEALPYPRLFNSPIAEGAIVGVGVGYALSGGRCVAELMYGDFIGRAGDEIFNQMAKWQSMSAGLLQMPLVLRVSVGSKYGAQHSQDWSSICAHIPGLKVMFPATAYDAKGMLNLALSGTDPVVFFESQRLYDSPEYFADGGVPEDYYEIEEGQPVIRRGGNDLTIVTIGATLFRAMEAAQELSHRHGIEAEVIDTRFINPLDYSKIVSSVKKTGKLILASDACERGSFLHTMASTLTRLVFDDLDGPVSVVGARNWITPPAELEHTFFPQAAWIIDAVHEQILPLADHRVSTDQSNETLLQRHRAGV